MNDHNHAREMLKLAGSDLNALRGMLLAGAESGHFTDEIYGFHAQQTVEKSLKAWIAAHEQAYPKTHDLFKLIEILNDLGEDVSGLSHLVEYSGFAVQFRYHDFDDEKLDREKVFAEVQTVFDEVSRRLAN